MDEGGSGDAYVEMVPLFFGSLTRFIVCQKPIL